MAVATPDEANAQSPIFESIEELFHALESPLLGYAMKLSQDIEMAQDLVQEAFLRLHTRFDEVRQPKSWLYRTIHNLAVNHHRRANKVVPLETHEESAEKTREPHDTEPLPDEQIAHLEAIGQVRLSITTLNERNREIIRLKFEEGLSYKAIAERTGLSASNVGYILHHTLKALALELEKTGIDL